MTPKNKTLLAWGGGAALVVGVLGGIGFASRWEAISRYRRVVKQGEGSLSRFATINA